MKVHVINAHRDHIELDKNFNLDLRHDVPTGPAHPHAAIVLPGRDE
jgi:hypothetical protein